MKGSKIEYSLVKILIKMENKGGNTVRTVLQSVVVIIRWHSLSLNSEAQSSSVYT
jgi:hypothetical protein